MSVQHTAGSLSFAKMMLTVQLASLFELKKAWHGVLFLCFELDVIAKGALVVIVDDVAVVAVVAALCFCCSVKGVHHTRACSDSVTLHE